MTDTATWALVCDAVRARIVRDLEDGALKAPGELVSRARSPHLRRFLSDPDLPGPASDLRRRGPSEHDATGPLLDDMREFGRETLIRLDRQFRAGAFRRLALFAPPRMLGILRAELPEALRGVVVHESAVDLVGLPEDALRERVLTSLEKAGAM